MRELIQKFKNAVITPKTQAMLNQPLKADMLEGKEEGFLKALIGKILNGEISTVNTQTLYNKAVYEKLSEEDQEKADLTAVNLMSVIRQIEKLWLDKPEPTYQVKNLVATVFQMKSRFEEKYGDVYTI